MRLAVKVAIASTGCIGLSNSVLLAQHNEVLCLDIVAEKGAVLTAGIGCGDKKLLLTERRSACVPVGEVRRFANPCTIPLEIIEVRAGSYLGEDDIVRFEDIYGRVSV